jgi:hypothetical protein
MLRLPCQFKEPTFEFCVSVSPSVLKKSHPSILPLDLSVSKTRAKHPPFKPLLSVATRRESMIKERVCVPENWLSCIVAEPIFSAIQ